LFVLDAAPSGLFGFATELPDEFGEFELKLFADPN
jgi:hypothetical protein